MRKLLVALALAACVAGCGSGPRPTPTSLGPPHPSARSHRGPDPSGTAPRITRKKR